MTDLNNALHLFAPLHKMSTPITRDDYIMETPVGCFRVAYSPFTHCTFLFYARHPDDLASTTDPGAIAHKDRLILIRGFRVHHGRNAHWNDDDKRQQFDLTWVEREIQKIAHTMPRIQFREANLHRLSEDTSSSVFVAYKVKPSLRVDGEFSIDVMTKTDINYRLVTSVDDSKLRGEKGKDLTPIGRLFRHTARQLLKNHANARFPLQTVDPLSAEHHTSFKSKTVRDTIEADHANRLAQIWNGSDPTLWKESPLLPIYRAKTAAIHQLEILDEMRHEDAEYLLRNGIAFGAGLLTDGIISMLAGKLLDWAVHFGAKEEIRSVPPEWHKLVDNNARRLVTINSNLHRILLRPDVEHFGDLRWLHPVEHVCSFAIDKAKLMKPDAERTFQNWLHSLFRAPYASLFEYRGAENKLLSPDHLNDVRLVKMEASNGVMMFYCHKEAKLYAYYNQPDYLTIERKLPADAGDYFKYGEVIELDLNRIDQPMRHHRFDVFQEEIRDLLKAPNLFLPNAHAPAPDTVNPTPIAPEAPARLPPSELPYTMLP